MVKKKENHIEMLDVLIDHVGITVVALIVVIIDRLIKYAVAKMKGTNRCNILLLLKSLQRHSVGQ